MILQQTIQAENKFSYNFPPRNLVEVFFVFGFIYSFFSLPAKGSRSCAESESTKCLWGALMMVFIFMRFTIFTSLPCIKFSPL